MFEFQPPPPNLSTELGSNVILVTVCQCQCTVCPFLLDEGVFSLLLDNGTCFVLSSEKKYSVCYEMVQNGGCQQ